MCNKIDDMIDDINKKIKEAIEKVVLHIFLCFYLSTPVDDLNLVITFSTP